GGQFGGGEESLKRMKKREADIWGAASTPKIPSTSRVQIEVSSLQTISDKEKPYDRSHHVSEGWQSRSYAAFPFQDDPQSVRKYRFILKLYYPESIKSETNTVDLRKEVEAALWAWQTFGGVGARTRRGFGALKTTDSLPKEPHKIEEYIRGKLEDFVAEG